MRSRQFVGWIALAVTGLLALAAALGAALMLLWNWLMPEIFGLPSITYWQALGLLVLCHLLFKGGLPHRPPIEHFQKRQPEPPAAGEGRERSDREPAPGVATER